MRCITRTIGTRITIHIQYTIAHRLTMDSVYKMQIRTWLWCMGFTRVSIPTCSLVQVYIWSWWSDTYYGVWSEMVNKCKGGNERQGCTSGVDTIPLGDHTETMLVACPCPRQCYEWHIVPVSNTLIAIYNQTLYGNRISVKARCLCGTLLYVWSKF